MQLQLRSIIADANTTNVEEMSQFLADQGVLVDQTMPGIDGLPALLKVDPPAFVIVNLDPDPLENLRKLGPLLKAGTGVEFFVMSSMVDPQLLMDAMHMGVREFIAVPMQEDRLMQAIDRVRASRVNTTRAKLIAFIPTIGGCGTTTSACNVAASLCKKGRTLLIDLDLTSGAVAEAFDVRPRFTIADIVTPSGPIDAQLVRNALTAHAPTGLSILSRPHLLEEAQKISASGFSRLLGVITTDFDYVVLDCTMDLNPLNTSAIRAADVNVLVVQPTVPSVRNAERYIAALNRMQIGKDRLRIVVNRMQKRGGDVEPRDIERALGLKIDCGLPNDFRNAAEAINFGEPVVLRAPRAELSARFGALADMLNGRSPV